MTITTVLWIVNVCGAFVAGLAWGELLHDDGPSVTDLRSHEPPRNSDDDDAERERARTAR